VQRADEMRARVLSNREAWAAIRRPVCHEWAPADFSMRSDDRREPLANRDPRAIEAEYAQLRRQFWNEKNDAGTVRLIARRCVLLARHLVTRAIDPEAGRLA
jgi:hypothetical protein